MEMKWRVWMKKTMVIDLKFCFLYNIKNFFSMTLPSF